MYNKYYRHKNNYYFISERETMQESVSIYKQVGLYILGLTAFAGCKLVKSGSGHEKQHHPRDMDTAAGICGEYKNILLGLIIHIMINRICIEKGVISLLLRYCFY